MTKRLRNLFTAAILCTASINADAQYCTNTYNYGCGYWGGHMHIKSFSTTGGSTNITSNNTGCSNSSGYTYYSTRIHTGVQGTTVNFTIGNCPYYTMNYRVWVDFNCDQDFVDAGENVYTGTINWGSSYSGSFTIPTTATPGTARLRVRAVPSWYSAPPPCGSQFYGETEDYGFVIVAACKANFTVQPNLNNSYACENGPGELNVDASNGTGYQWQILQGANFVNLSNGPSYAGVTTKKLQMFNVPSSMQGKKFRCLVTACSPAAQFSSDTLSLPMAQNVKILSHTITDTSCIGLSTYLAYKAEGTISGSRWQRYDNNLKDYVDVAGMPYYPNLNGDTLRLLNLPDTLNGAKMRCIVIGQCGQDTTAPIILSVNAIPVVVTDPKDQNLKQGDDATFKVVAAGIGVKYQWQVGVNGNFANINEGGIYAGAKSDVLTVHSVSRPQNEFEFRCIVVGSGSCKLTPDTSEIAILTVDPPVSVMDVLKEKSVTVFPNPAAGSEVVIKTENAITEFLSVYKITDKTGRAISVGNLNSDGSTTVNISRLSTGTYFVQVLDKEGALIKTVPFTRL